jgi:hypothetical protein
MAPGAEAASMIDALADDGTTFCATVADGIARVRRADTTMAVLAAERSAAGLSPKLYFVDFTGSFPS